MCVHYTYAYTHTHTHTQAKDSQEVGMFWIKEKVYICIYGGCEYLVITCVHAYDKIIIRITDSETVR